MLARVLAALFGLLALALPALAREEIQSFDTQIAVYVTGNVFVTDAITVKAEGVDIKHGIFRDIALEKGQTLQVLTAKRNGADEHVSVEPNGALQRIRIGDPNVLLDPGVYTYDVSYIVMKAVGPLGLNWHVTGTWSFPILKASVKVLPPPGQVVDKRAALVICGKCGTQHTISDDQAAFTAYRIAEPMPPGDDFVLSMRFSAPNERTRTKLDR